MLLLTVLLALFRSLGMAQNLSGRVIGKTGLPLKEVEVILTDSAGGKIAFLKTQDDGRFRFNDIKSDYYKVKIAFLGYETFTSKMIAFAVPEINLGDIRLNESAKQIEQIAIVGLKTLFKQELDKYIYNVQDDPESKNAKALDMLNKIPIIDMEGDRNLKVNGQAVTFLVDGRKSILFKANADAALRSMPAHLIKSIEVITNPSAKFSDQGLGAVINIITKKKYFEGYIGSLGAYATSLDNIVATTSGTIKAGRLAYSGEYTYWFQNPPENISYLLRSGLNGRVLKSAMNGRSKGIYVFGYNAFSYELDTLNLLNLSLSLNHSNDRNYSFRNNISFQASAKQLDQQITNYQYAKAFSPSLSMDYQKTFKNNGSHLLIFSYQYTQERGHDTSDYARSELVNSVREIEQNINISKEKENTLQVDYTLPFEKHGTFEAGAKGIFRARSADNDYLSYAFSLGRFETIPSYTNSFSYRQNIYSVYMTYGSQFSKWGYKLGLRLESTLDEAEFLSTNTFLNRDYISFLPSAFISKKISKKIALNFSYSKRIIRPGLYYLNPFVDLRNPENIIYGNPALQPEKSSLLEMNFNVNGKIYLRNSFYFRKVTDALESVSWLENDITKTTFQNLGVKNTFGLRISVDKRFTNFSTSVRFNFSYLELNQPSAGISNSGFLYNPEIRLNYSQANRFRTSIQAGYNSSQPTIQGEVKGQFYNFFLLGKDLLKKKLSVSLSARNFLIGELKTKSTVISPDFTQILNGIYRQQEFKLNFTYSFGNLKDDLKRTQKNISNDDLKSGVKKTDIKVGT